METDRYSKLAKDSTRQIRIVDGKQAEPTNIRQFYSTLSAYEQLFVNDTTTATRSILQNAT